MTRPLDCHGEATLVSGTGPGPAPRLYLATVRDVGTQLARVLVVDRLVLVGAKETYLASRSVSATEACLLRAEGFPFCFRLWFGHWLVTPLEWNIVRGNVSLFRVSATVLTGGGGGTTSLAVEEIHAVGDDLVARPLLTVLSFPGACLKPSLDVDEAALGKVLVALFCQLSPADDGEPLGLLAALAFG